MDNTSNAPSSRPIHDCGGFGCMACAAERDAAIQAARLDAARRVAEWFCNQSIFVAYKESKLVVAAVSDSDLLRIIGDAEREK